MALLLPGQATAQANAAQAETGSAASNQGIPEISARDEPTTFKVKVNLVEVRVVVRDAHGHAVGNLRQQDFQLFDNGKPQNITKFSAEQAEAKPVIHREAVPEIPAEVPSGITAPPPPMPERYVAYLFDDVHLQFSDLAQARNAALKQLRVLRPEDRAAIFTTSGQTQLDFTGNGDQLAATLNRVVPRGLDNTGTTPCPNISYYMADLIANKNDLQATQTAVQDASDCGFALDSNEIRAYARRELSIGDEEVRLALGALRTVVRRMAELPGQRTIILVSPGFMNRDELQRQTEAAERALHSNVVINTLDARGLYTNLPDASEQRPAGPLTAGKMQEYRTAEQDLDQNVLAELADATGGTFFHNNNDLDEGFRRLALPPEFSYLLAFSPQDLKLDGRYHKLKVTLKPPASGAIQARKGYYAPKGSGNPSEQAKQAIEDEVFSQEEVRDIPVELYTRFFKPDQEDAKLSVVVRMDIRHVHFRKVDGRNSNDMTVVSALFDRNGNFLSGTQKLVQLRLKDATLASRLGSGITLKSSFDVKPGSYVVRLVVRGEDGQLAAQNSAVEIP
ncbi:MAG TPA: VWA domain-containing protein [Candidatus Binatia bacterium]|nr:VWA domain-containing protein [Candidatus Binatia bacterium]